MYVVTEEVKNNFKSVGTIKRGYIRLIPLSDEEEIIFDENSIKQFRILDDIYTPEEGVIGSVIAKELSIELFKPSEINLINREVEVFIGVEDKNGEATYVSYGTYIIQKPENEVITENTTFEALDYMIKFNVPYVDSLQYPTTLKKVLNSICKLSEVILGTLTFANEDFIVENNQFVNGETCRDVLKAICQQAGCYAKINRNNILELKTLGSEPHEIDDTEYYPDIKINQLFGPVNRLVLRMSQVEGENVVIQDDESIELNGLKELIIYDNPFTYTQEKREQSIEAIWEVVRGLTYYDFETKNVPRPYADTGDNIDILVDKEVFSSYILTQEIIFNGGLNGTISATTDTEAETKYAFQPNIASRLKRTEIVVDKHGQSINEIVEQVEGNTKQITQQKLEIGSINSSVKMLGGNNKQQNSVGAFGVNGYEGGTLLINESYKLKENGDTYTASVNVNSYEELLIYGNNSLSIQIVQLDENDTQLATDTFTFETTESKLFRLKNDTKKINVTVTKVIDTIDLSTFNISYNYKTIEALETEELKNITESGRAIKSDNFTWYKLKSENLIIGNIYTVSFLYKNSKYNGLKIKLLNNTITDLVNIDPLEAGMPYPNENLFPNANLYPSYIDTNTYSEDFEKIEYTFVANTSNVELYVETHDYDVQLADYYLQTGDEATVWQQGQGEIRGTNVQINRDGLEVINENSETRTIIDSLGFNVKNKDGKTLITANKDEALLADTSVEGDFRQGHWRRYVQKIEGKEILLEVYE